MKFKSVFDIIGPVMIGPSSSHTAGAARIGMTGRRLLGGTPDEAVIHLYGSFANTYKGHGTDVAIVGGLLGYDTFDERIVNALAEAEKAGMTITFIEEEAVPDHPNTARLVLKKGDDEIEMVGISIGGGSIEITEVNGYPLRLSGERPAMIVLHHDRYGAVAQVAGVLARYQINISYMEVSRKDKGQKALMLIETDEKLNDEIKDEIEQLEHMTSVVSMT